MSPITGPCSCGLCSAMPPVRPCLAYNMLNRLGALETAVVDMLQAKSATDCLKCIAVFRVLMKEPP